EACRSAKQTSKARRTRCPASPTFLGSGPSKSRSEQMPASLGRLEAILLALGGAEWACLLCRLGSGSSSAVPAAQIDRVTIKRDRGLAVLPVSRLMYFAPRVGTLVPRPLDQPRPPARQRPQCPQGPGPLGLHPPRLQRLQHAAEAEHHVGLA